MPFTLPAGVPIRIISNLSTADTTYVIGAVPRMVRGQQNGYDIVLRPLSAAQNDTTLFSIEPHGAEGFRLKWGGSSQPYRYLAWGTRGGPIHFQDQEAFLTKENTYFTVDSVRDGNWFALNDYRHGSVVDVDHSGTADKTPINSHRWNDGDNQCWRFEYAPT